MAKQEAIRTPRADTKMARAAKIFCDMIGFDRSFVINRFQSELKLTPAGASTYYQTCRRKSGMVIPKSHK